MKRFLFLNPTLYRAFLFSTLLYLLLTLAVLFAGKANTIFLENRAQSSFANGLATEKTYSVTTGNAFAENSGLKSAIRTKDSYNVLTLLNSLNDKRFAGVAVTDTKGIVFSRTLTSLGRGDNSLVISPLGRALVRTGTTTFSIEKNFFNPSQLVISSVRYVKDHNENLGALFTTDFMDNAYAVNFANKYLPKNVKVIFYSQKYGIYGDNINDTPTRETIGALFYPDSDWIARGKTNTTIRLPNGNYYAIINVVFPGLEHSPGGAILLVPIYSFLAIADIAVGLIVLGFFFFMITRHRRWILASTTKRYSYYLPVLLLLFMAFIILIADLSTQPNAESQGSGKLVLYNSVLGLDPQTLLFDASYTQSVSVKVNTGPEDVNTIGVALGYDPASLDVKDISVDHSICTQIIENTVDSKKGEINFSCIITNPGFSGVGNVFTLTMQAHAAGTFSLHFLPDTQVLANDGLGTNVLRIATDGSYEAINTSSPTLISIYSPTHPNSEEWYSNRLVDLIWDDSATSTYAYSFDTSSSSLPSLKNTVVAKKITLKAPDDGIYYLHLAQVVNGKIKGTNSYKVRIDTTPPDNIKIRSSSVSLKVGEVARLDLSASDTESGLQKNYYLSVNKGLFLPVPQSVYVPFLSPGTNILTVRAYDNAGNYSESKIQIVVKGTPIQNMLSPIFSPK